jgi:hypothetical protein
VIKKKDSRSGVEKVEKATPLSERSVFWWISVTCHGAESSVAYN